MKEILYIFANPRLWGAFVYLTLPLLGCLIAGGYLVVKEELKKCLKHRKDK